jgi:bifunctional non-homologous end joining protein LigD
LRAGPAFFTVQYAPTRSLAADPWADFRAAAAPIEERKKGKPSRGR